MATANPGEVGIPDLIGTVRQMAIRPLIEVGRVSPSEPANEGSLQGRSPSGIKTP